MFSYYLQKPFDSSCKRKLSFLLGGLQTVCYHGILRLPLYHIINEYCDGPKCIHDVGIIFALAYILCAAPAVYYVWLGSYIRACNGNMYEDHSVAGICISHIVRLSESLVNCLYCAGPLIEALGRAGCFLCVRK